MVFVKKTVSCRNLNPWPLNHEPKNDHHGHSPSFRGFIFAQMSKLFWTVSGQKDVFANKVSPFLKSCTLEKLLLQRSIEKKQKGFSRTLRSSNDLDTLWLRQKKSEMEEGLLGKSSKIRLFNLKSNFFPKNLLFSLSQNTPSFWSLLKDQKWRLFFCALIQNQL